MTDRAAAVSAWESLFRAQVAIMRSLASDFPSREISFNEYDVLFNLSREPDRRIRLRDLNQHVLLTQPSVSRLIDRLASRGYIRKLTDPNDGRGAIVELTDAGYALFRSVAVDHMGSISARFGDALSNEELEQLTSLCDRLRIGPAGCPPPEDLPC
ncbi:MULTISPECIES: MarR family winged helix-turn-helix transcriptional regulator [Cryobacterium]|nr:MULTISPECIES: MarR family transcriptional regulator [Cryobacterium]MDY7529414.1 MarR family transcriptional regulator [Cryobacterium sp. 10C2]MDY7558436.1 MarR family transcriptional regulator [Cryobacterium sp. 10C3]MEB0001701.1 MarR family transcriptional regulator [Cryobacterium sp. RTC2.1]MEB0201676.1 MarR family transcriptional regulator [Cryobacterium sp. 5I3]MEB0286734.1 MarR family transcriptional regulator [Cryobacterium sp. 10S3]